MSDEWEYVSPPIKRIATITADGTVIVHDAAALVARIAQLEAAIKAAMDNELELDNERGSTWHILNDALAPKEAT